MPASFADRDGEPAPATGRADPLGLVLAALGALALAAGPFVTVKANRIADGEPTMLLEALPVPAGLLLLGLLGLVAVVAILARQPGVRLLAAAAGLAGVFAALAESARRLLPTGDGLGRVSPDWGFWLVAASLALALADAGARLRPSPLGRVLALGLVTVIGGAVLHAGWLDGLSVMREYAVRTDVFGRELGRHLALALGSAAAALAIGLPLGIALHEASGARGPVLAGLTVIQAVPSIALFGLLMGPLAWLAHAVPLFGAWGLRGIGAAPAFVALTLYALLPVVATTSTGLAGVAPEAVDAARGSGMTRGEVLRLVKIPLALPAMLSGVRVVVVQAIGLTTVAALIGGGGLGTFVFQGLGQTAIDLVLLGAIPTVAMAFAAAVLLDAAAEALRWT